MRMVESGDRARFAFEAGSCVGIARDVGRKDLDRDRAIEARVARFVHLAHAARAEGREDLVGAKA
jgi:hypothetical protein